MIEVDENVDQKFDEMPDGAVKDRLCRISEQIMKMSSRLDWMSSSLDNIVGDLSEIIDGTQED